MISSRYSLSFSRTNTESISKGSGCTHASFEYSIDNILPENGKQIRITIERCFSLVARWLLAKAKVSRPIEKRFNGESILVYMRFCLCMQSKFGRCGDDIFFYRLLFQLENVRHAQPKKRMKWRILFVNFILLDRVDDDETNDEQYGKIVRYLWIKIERIKWNNIYM